MEDSVYEDTLAITQRSQRHLDRGDGYVPWGTGLVEGAKDLASRAIGQLQEWAKEDPDTWTDDLLRLTGGGIKNVGNTMADWERRSEEGEWGLRSATGTALRFMNWSSEQGARLGRTGARAIGVNEELGGFLGSFLPEAIGTKGLSKAVQIGKTTKQLSKLRKLGITDWQLDDITKGYHAMAFGDQPTSLLGDIKTAATTSKKARNRLNKLEKNMALRTGAEAYTPTKEVLSELDESMKLFGQKMDRYNELKELRKPFIGLKSPEAKELAKKLGTKYIREGDVNTALRQARDAFSAAPRSAVKEYLGEMADLGYDAAKGKPGGKPRSGSGLHQHHIDANVEAYSRTRLLNKLGTTFKVQAQRYIADVYEMAPARARANMANIPADLHLGDLHPWLKSMGIETYWRDLWKANPRGISKQQMVSAIDNYFDEVVFPSLVKMDNLVKKSPTKISETHLPQNVVEAARKRIKELANEPVYKSKFSEGSTAAEVMMDKRIEDLYIKGSESKIKVWGEALE